MKTAVIKNETLNEFYTDEKCFISEVLNREDYAPISVAKARVAPGVTTITHRLKGTDEMYYILSGTGEVEIDGKQVGTVKELDLVFIPAGKDQRITNTSDKYLVFLCICSPRFEVKNYQQ